MQNKKAVKLIAMLLALLTLSACAQTKPTETPETVAEVTAEETTTEPEFLDTLEAKNYEAAEYLLYSAGSFGILNPPTESLNGEVVNDAQYNRDEIIAARYNVDIGYVQTGSLSATNVKNAVQSGDKICDVFMSNAIDAGAGLGPISSAGALYNLLDVPNLNPTNKWWSGLMYENLSYNNKLFFTSGDLAVPSYIGPACVYLNLDIAADYSVDPAELYQLAYDGTWTLDEFYARYEGLDNDLNGDGKMDIKDDFYGLVNESNVLTSNLLLTSAGVKLCEKTDDGQLTVNLNNETVLAVIEKMTDSFVQVVDNSRNADLYDICYKSGRALFGIHYIESTIRRFRDMDSDYAILPMPKYETSQESYISYINPWVSGGFIGIPLVQTDIDMTGFITEALAYQSYVTVRPAIYEVTLKGKAAVNEDCMNMIDMVFDTTYLDFNGIYDFGGSTTAVNSAIFGKRSFASTYASAESKIDAAIMKFAEAYQ